MACSLMLLKLGHKSLERILKKCLQGSFEKSCSLRASDFAGNGRHLTGKFQHFYKIL